MLNHEEKNSIVEKQMFRKLRLTCYLLLMFGVSVLKAQQIEDFILACKTGNMKVVKRTLKDNFDINAKVIDDGTTALMLASAEGQAEVVKFLIENGANINASKRYGYTPLMLAIKKNQAAIVQLLIENGADIHAKNELDETPLLIAVENCNEAIARRLIDQGADMRHRTIIGQEALQIAATRGCTEVVRVLLEKGVDINDSYDKSQTTALMTAARFGHSELVKLLLESGAEIDRTNRGGNTALLFAVQNGHEDIVRQLLEAGASINDKNILGYTPLLYAVDFHQRDMVKLLIEKGADVNAETNSKMTAINMAKKDKDSVMVAFLKDHGALEVDSTKHQTTSPAPEVVNPHPNVANGANVTAVDSMTAPKVINAESIAAANMENVSADSLFKSKDEARIIEKATQPDSQTVNKVQFAEQDSTINKMLPAATTNIEVPDSSDKTINQKLLSQMIDENKPHPMGGFNAIQNNLKMPQIVKEGKIKGTVVINVTVDQKGVLKQTKFVKLLMNKECNTAALEAIKSAKWEPGVKDGKPITASIDVSLEFQP